MEDLIRILREKNESVPPPLPRVAAPLRGFPLGKRGPHLWPGGAGSTVRAGGGAFPAPALCLVAVAWLVAAVLIFWLM